MQHYQATGICMWSLLERHHHGSSRFFTYDKQNYSQFLATQFQELLSFESWHPNVYEEFQKGNSSVQLSDNNTFGRMEPDGVIETTITRDIKAARGSKGSLNWNFP